MKTRLKYGYVTTALYISLLAMPVSAAPIQNPENIQQASASSGAARLIRYACNPACRKALTKAMEQATEKFRGLLFDLGGHLGEIYEAGLKAWQEGDRKQLAELKRQLEATQAELAKETAKNKELETQNRVLKVQLNQIYQFLTALENNIDVGV